jgi:hypothetical protein
MAMQWLIHTIGVITARTGGKRRGGWKRSLFFSVVTTETDATIADSGPAVLSIRRDRLSGRAFDFGPHVHATQQSRFERGDRHF